jgi:Uma2 family endonuclease
MAAKGTPHVVALQLLADVLRPHLGSHASIRTQDPIHLDDFSEPEPDLVIVRGSILDYTEHHPYPEDILLVVEVADSTLKIDCEVKAQLYAQANLPEYWVLDLKNRQLVVFRNPSESGDRDMPPARYRDRQGVGASGMVSPVGLSNINLSVAAMLPPEKTPF